MGTVTVAAIDLGASSGRVVVGEVSRTAVHIDTVARFPNTPVRLADGLHWNILELYRQACDGLRVAAARTPLAGVGIDTWAIDYGLLRHGRLIGPPFHYRDERCSDGVDRVHSHIDARQMYEQSGLQFLAFNTVYQLAADVAVPDADALLLIPDLIGYWLTGGMVAERTNASTTGLLDVHNRRWNDELLANLGLRRELFGELVDPGVTIGPLLPHTGVAGVPLIAVGSHDTASAVVGVPMSDDGAAYVSCGTWGLVGLELEHPIVTEAAFAANFTNEAGVDGRTRFLTNVMGTWLLSETLRSWGEPELDGLLAAAAQVTDPVPVIDVQDPRFVPPGDMPARIAQWCVEHNERVPPDRASLVRCIIESLAQAFANAVEAAETLGGVDVSTVHLVGGGAQNTALCQSLADRCGRVVVAGPVEATAIGNVLVQARAVGAVNGGLDALRRLIGVEADLVRYVPRTSALL